MIIKQVALGNSEGAFIEDRFTDGVNIIFSDENNKGKTLIIQGMMYALGNQPIFPKGFDYNDSFFYCKFEIEKRELEILRKRNKFAFKISNKIFLFDSVTELKYFLKQEGLMPLPQITKDNQEVICDLDMFFEIFFIGQDKRNPSNIINTGNNNKKDFISMLCSLNGHPLMNVEEQEKDFKKKIRQIKAEIDVTKKCLKLEKTNPNVSGYVNKFNDSEQLDHFKSEIRKCYEIITNYKKARTLEINRKEKLQALIHELNSLNREIKKGNVVCATCGSNKIIYKNEDMSFEVSNSYVRKHIMNSIQYQILQKEEIIREYTMQIQMQQDNLKILLQDVPVEIKDVLLYSEIITSEIDYDNKLQNLSKQLKELEDSSKNVNKVEKEAKTQYKMMKKRIIEKMNESYREVDPQGSTRFDDIFTKKNETYSGSDEQEYYYARMIALNDFFQHSFPLIIDCYRSGEISSKKEDIMIKNFINRKKQVIITSTLKAEEYSSNKYDQYKNSANVIDYSNNEPSKILQPDYMFQFREIVKSFGVIFDE